MRAGAPGTNFPVLLNGMNLGIAVEPWYVVEARADADGDGVFCDAIATSLNNELVIMTSKASERALSARELKAERALDARPGLE